MDTRSSAVSSRRRRIGVLWGTGRVGQELIAQALDRGYEVVTLVRRPAKMRIEHEALDLIAWDATRAEDVAQLLSRVDVLYHTVSVPFMHRKPTFLYSRVAEAVIKARSLWDNAELPAQYIVMSSFGTHHGRRLPRPFSWGYEWFLGDVADDKEREEELLVWSDLPWSVLKAVVLTNRPQQAYRLQSFDEVRPSVWARVSRATVASALLDMADITTVGSHGTVSPALQKQLDTDGLVGQKIVVSSA